jgi:hypothetical protein
LDSDPDMAGTGLGEFALNNRKGSARGGHLDCTASY